MSIFSFGGESKKEKSSFSKESEEEFEKSGLRAGATSETLKLDQRAIEKIISDVLGGPQGLASIFSGEQTAGIFNSSVAAQASGDVVANIIGELSKLTAERVSTSVESSSERGTARGSESGKSKGKSSGFKFGVETGSGVD